MNAARARKPGYENTAQGRVPIYAGTWCRLKKNGVETGWGARIAKPNMPEAMNLTRIVTRDGDRADTRVLMEKVAEFADATLWTVSDVKYVDALYGDPDPDEGMWEPDPHQGDR